MLMEFNCADIPMNSRASRGHLRLFCQILEPAERPIKVLMLIRCQ